MANLPKASRTPTTAIPRRQLRRQFLDDLLAITGTALAALFFLNDLATDLVVGVDLRQVRRVGDLLPRPFDQRDDTNGGGEWSRRSATLPRMKWRTA